MWPLIRWSNAGYNEFHPVVTERINDKHNAVKCDEIVKSRIMF
jgi:hypothetical protein